MKGFVKEDKRTELEKEYDRAVERLKTYEIGTKEYDELLAFVERLRQLVDSEKKTKPAVSPDTIVGGVLALAQIGVIVGYERFHNITSKAMGFVTKGRAR